MDGNFNESTVEGAALAWFAELGYAIGHGPQLAPREPATERDTIFPLTFGANENMIWKVPLPGAGNSGTFAGGN
jgi:hypothetical protein